MLVSIVTRDCQERPESEPGARATFTPSHRNVEANRGPKPSDLSYMDEHYTGWLAGSLAGWLAGWPGLGLPGRLASVKFR